MNAVFDYELPPHLIAQVPAEPRDSSRLMVLRRADQSIAHHRFRDLPALLNPGDLLALNDTRVVPARLIGLREKTGGKWEGLFLKQTPDGLWEILAQTKGKPETGESFRVADSDFRLILRVKADGRWLMAPSQAGSAIDLLSRVGRIPLPPYIRKGRADDNDRDRYQTVYARADGSVAAPTAGLHFTPTVFEGLRAQGVRTASVTLHVGLGTFEPMRTDDPRQHQMHPEWAEVPHPTVSAVREARARGGRVIAVGTTSVRSLETAARHGELGPFRGETNLFIQPPHEFKVVDGMITNFHLPRTTLLLLVGAMAGMDLLHTAYETAIAERYRFYSYGDAMLIL
jgi:S-adenosylmethionine:tRNA ribosyltransferase-isomerase